MDFAAQKHAALLDYLRRHVDDFCRFLEERGDVEAGEIGTFSALKTVRR